MLSYVAAIVYNMYMIIYYLPKALNYLTALSSIHTVSQVSSEQLINLRNIYVLPETMWKRHTVLIYKQQSTLLIYKQQHTVIAYRQQYIASTEYSN